MKTIIAIMGKTSSSKDTAAKYIEREYGIPAVCSCTTRAMRAGEQDGVEHYFISKEQMAHKVKTEHVLAYTKNAKTDIEYCATVESMSADTMVYIINPEGLQWLEKHNPEVNLIKIYMWLSEDIIKERALKRGDSEELIDTRLNSEREEFDNYFNQVCGKNGINGINGVITTNGVYIVDAACDMHGIYYQIDQILQQALQRPANNNQLPYSRLEEIATNALHALVTADPVEAKIYFTEELELTDTEMEYFGVSNMSLF